MIKRIVFLIESPFNLRDYQRYGIELLQKNGFNVEVWDLTPIRYLGISQGYTLPDPFDFEGLTLLNNRSEMREKLSSLSREDFVINLGSYNFQTLGVYRALSRSSADYAVSCVGAIPSPVIMEGWLDFLVEKARDIASFRYPKAWKRLIMKLPLKFLGVKPARLILAGGEKCFNYHFPTGKNTEILQIHALDYDLYLKERGNACAERSIAVFLDSFEPFHPDYIRAGTGYPVSADRYYKLLNDFFDIVEEKTGLEVVIAAHPRSYYDKLPDYFNGRKCIRCKTASLVKECRLVLDHGSTSLNFANLFYKPVIFMTFSCLAKSYRGCLIREFARWFGKEPIAIYKDNNIDWERELKVSRSHYDNYRRAYIKTEDSEDLLSWQVVANRLKKE